MHRLDKGSVSSDSGDQLIPSRPMCVAMLCSRGSLPAPFQYCIENSGKRLNLCRVKKSVA